MLADRRCGDISQTRLIKHSLFCPQCGHRAAWRVIYGDNIGAARSAYMQDLMAPV